MGMGEYLDTNLRGKKALYLNPFWLKVTAELNYYKIKNLPLIRHKSST